MKISSSLKILGIFAIISVIMPLLMPLGLPVFIIVLLSYIFIYATLSQSWNYIGGYTGYVLFGANMFFGIGAYVTALLLYHYGVSVFVTAFLGAFLAAGFALLIGRPTLRLRGPYFSIATLAVSTTLSLFVMSELWLTMGSRGVPNLWDPIIPRVGREIAYYYIFLTLMMASALVGWKIENSKFGYGLLAIRQNEDTAPVLGIDTTNLKVRAFMLCAFFTALTGAFYSPYMTWISPDSVLSMDITLSPILMALFGGAGTFFGPIIGAFLLESLKRYIIFYLVPGSSAHLLPFGVLLAFVMLYLPNGIISLFRGRGFALVRRKGEANKS